MTTGNEPPEPVPGYGTPQHLQRTTGPDGRWLRNPDTATRDAQAAALRNQGWTFQAIADELGYADKGEAHHAIDRAFRDLAAPAKSLRDKRARELELLWESGLEILNNHHVVVSHGKIIEVDGVALRDDGPRLQAIGHLRQINESFRKLDGTDAPSRVSVEAEQIGREISRLLDDVLGPGSDGDTDT